MRDWLVMLGKGHWKLCWLLLWILPAVLNCAVSQEVVGADSLNVGNPFSLIITSDYAISRVSIPDSLDSFTIIGSAVNKEDGKSWKLQIVPMRTGALSFPQLQVQPIDRTINPEYTDALRIYVLSVLAEGDTLLRDIKPLQRYPWQPGFWVYVLFVFIALVLAVYLLIKKLSLPAKIAEPAATVVQKQEPVWRVALAKLDELLGSDLLEQGKLVEFHYGLSEILREFLERMYRFNALEMTISEISQVLNKRQIKSGAEIRSFLIQTDMVKFAKAEPVRSDIMTRIDWLKEYLTRFRDENTEVKNA